MILWERFDSNEWFVFALLAVSWAAIILLPRKVPASIMVLGLVWGFASSMLFDFTIGGGLMDFYRVNDSDRFEVTDLLTYCMFAPFGYFFVYFYEVLKISKRTLIYYILCWTAVGAGFQWLAELARMTTYQNGYRLEYNIPVFLFIQTVTGLFYRMIGKRAPQPDGPVGGVIRARRA